MCNILLVMDYEILKRRRELLGLTQAELADYTGLSLRFISSVEAGKANPSVDKLLRIADVLGLEIELKVRRSDGD